MSKTCYQKGKFVNIVELCHLPNSLVLEHKTHVLCTVRAVKIIVILDLSVISTLNLLSERDKFPEIDLIS